MLSVVENLDLRRDVRSSGMQFEIEVLGRVSSSDVPALLERIRLRVVAHKMVRLTGNLEPAYEVFDEEDSFTWRRKYKVGESGRVLVLNYLDNNNVLQPEEEKQKRVGEDFGLSYQGEEKKNESRRLQSLEAVEETEEERLQRERL